MKRILPLVMSVFMFILTTTLMVLILGIEHPFDVEQKLLLGMLLFMGYLASGLYAFVYIDNRKRVTRPQRF